MPPVGVIHSIEAANATTRIKGNSQVLPRLVHRPPASLPKLPCGFTKTSPARTSGSAHERPSPSSVPTCLRIRGAMGGLGLSPVLAREPTHSQHNTRKLHRKEFICIDRFVNTGSIILRLKLSPISAPHLHLTRLGPKPPQKQRRLCRWQHALECRLVFSEGE